MNYSLRELAFALSIRLMKWPRKWYHEMKAKKCSNSSISLLCNNCTGGVILHELGLPFKTPTINIDIRNRDEFLYFVEHIKELKEPVIEEIGFEKYEYPAGRIIHNGKIIDIVFTHYKSFEEGREKWLERTKRIDYDNLYVLFEGPNVTDLFMERFAKLPYKKAILSSLRDDVRYDFYHGFKFYRKWKPGKILNYKSWFNVKRYLDDFDYVAFLNEK